MRRTVLLAGATGYIGSKVGEEFLRHGYDLVCPVRNPDAAALAGLRALVADEPRRLNLLPCDLSAGADALATAAVPSVEAVVSCLASRSGGVRDSERVEYEANHNLLAWALRNEVRHFTLLSAICVQKPRLAFQHAKLRFEKELADSGLGYSIVRPTAFFKSLSGQLDRVRAGKPFLLFGDGTLTACKPIAEEDLARYLRRTLEDPRLTGILPVGGPGPALTPRDQAQLLADLTGQPLRTRSVPPRMLQFVAGLLSLPGLFSEKLADKAEFARIGHYYATESMLLWDPATGRYDADATPEFGTVTLADSYRDQLAGDSRQDLGEHALFARRKTDAS